MAKKNEGKEKFSFKKRLFPLAMGAVMAITPFMLVGCSNGQDGKNGVDGAKWYRGTTNIEYVTEGKAGDFYIDTDDYKLYQKESDGSWTLVMENFGKPGNDGGQGTPGASSYTYVRYASDANGTGFSATYSAGLNYISILTTNSETAPEASAFTTWIKFVGDNGGNGQSNYVWVKYADNMPDSNDDMKDTISSYIGIYNGTSSTAPTDYTQYNWMKIVGNDGQPGGAGQSNYVWIKYADEMPDANSDMKDTAGAYIGVYNGTNDVAPTDYTQYTWYKIAGETGGEGQPGQNGQSVFIAYATQADGSDMTETFEETCEYLGIYTGSTAPTGDNAYQSYTWIKFREATTIVNVSMEYGDEYTATGATFISGEGVLTENNGVFTASTLGNAKLRASNGDILNVSVTQATVDVVLFTGQSNMVGRDTSQYTAEIKNGQAYEYKYNNGGEDSLVAVANPVGETFGNVEVSSGSSIVPEFCELYTNQTGRKIVAVHVARGGRAISNFEQGGAVYQNIISKYTGAIDYLTENENFNIGKKFYLMFQGESDTGSTTKEDYKTKYLSFHNGLKTAFGMEFGAMFYTGRDSTAYADGIVRINTAKYELATENDDIILCSDSASEYITTNPEYLKSDNVHFNAAGMQALAAEACTSIVNYLGYGEENLTGVDPVTYITSGAPEGGSSVEELDGIIQYNGEYISATQLGNAGAGTTLDENGYTCTSKSEGSYFQLDSAISLSAQNDWEIEWKGKNAAYESSTLDANVILGPSSSSGAFLTYQKNNGIYLKTNGGAQSIKFNASEIVNTYQFEEHTWKLVYTASTNTIKLYMDNQDLWDGQTLTSNCVFDLVFTSKHDSYYYNYYFCGNIRYINVTQDTTSTEPETPVTFTTYEWNFESSASSDDGSIVATQVGTGAPTFDSDGYTMETEGVYYTMSSSLVLDSTKDWSLEWEGSSSSMSMPNDANVLFGHSSKNEFITYQASNGIYVKGTTGTAYKFNDATVLAALYENHAWKLQYVSSENKLYLYLDGEVVQSMIFVETLTFDTLFTTKASTNYCFTGNLKYLRISLAE